MSAQRFQGVFITIEKTGEKLGGSTQAMHLSQRLAAAGHQVVLTREPGGTLLGKQFREMLLSKAVELSKATELFLYVADRAQHYKEVLKPALKAGKFVVSDRYFDSSLVYQGYGRGWKTAFLWRLHHAATGSLLPDLTIVLDGTPMTSYEKTDRFESLGEDFFQRVRQGMLHLTTKSKRYVLLQANVDEIALADQIFNVVKERFPEYF